MAKNILIGKITSSHGISGSVNIISYAENPGDIAKYSPILDKNGQVLKLEVTSKAKGKNGDIFIARIENIKTRNDADLLRGTQLFIERSCLKNLADNEFYYVDLIGLDALDMNGNKIGKVIDVNDFGAGGMIEIEFDSLSNDKNKFEILPFSNDIVPEVNLEKGYLKIDFPEIIEAKE